MSDQQTSNPQATQAVTAPVTVNVDANTAFTLKLQEFDKAIGAAKAQAAALEAQKAAYVYDTNLNMIVEQSKAKDAVAAAPVAEPPKA